MSDEQLQRDVADIRVIVGETRTRVVGLARDMKRTDRDVADLRQKVNDGDRWRYKMIGAGAVVFFGVNVGVSVVIAVVLR